MKTKTGKFIQCKTCGKTFYIPINRFNSAKYCSPKCRGEAGKHQFYGICEICGKQFSYIACREGKAKYCSRTCYYKAMHKKGTKENICKQCGKVFLSPPSHKRIYCSMKCLGESKKKIFTINGRGGIRRALKRRNFMTKCMECGYDKFPEILGVHHKDMNNMNNDLKNILVLCPNCHSIKHLKHIPH